MCVFLRVVHFFLHNSSKRSHSASSRLRYHSKANSQQWSAVRSPSLRSYGRNKRSGEPVSLSSTWDLLDRHDHDDSEALSDRRMYLKAHRVCLSACLFSLCSLLSLRSPLSSLCSLLSTLSSLCSLLSLLSLLSLSLLLSRRVCDLGNAVLHPRPAYLCVVHAYLPW